MLPFQLPGFFGGWKLALEFEQSVFQPEHEILPLALLAFVNVLDVEGLLAHRFGKRFDAA